MFHELALGGQSRASNTNRPRRTTTWRRTTDSAYLIKTTPLSPTPGDPRAGLGQGSVTGNTLHDNCSGLVFLNTGTIAGVSNWRASHNTAVHNDIFCPAGDLPFSLTGVGILIAGGDHILLRDNTVRANQPSGPPTFINGVALAGGIVVISTASVSFSPDTTEARQRTTSS